MISQKKELYITGGIALIAVALAYCFRFIGKGSFYPTLFSYLRSFIYIGLFAAWGLTVRQRIVQNQVRKYLTYISFLLIFWIASRTAKYFIFWQPDAIRYLWYLFYLPMLFVPMLALLIAMSLGKPDNYRLPGWTVFLWIISGVLLLLVLTNDLHQMVFTFSREAIVWTDQDNGYAIGYYIVFGWQVLCAVAAFVLMLLKCRIPNGKQHFLPIVPFLLSIVYSIFYYTGVNWLRFLFGDLAVFQSIMYVLTFELCIACGYIHSNSRYADLFESSVGTSAEITDQNFNVCYAARNIEEISKKDMQKAKQHPIAIKNGLTLHTMPIGGGYAVWTEDVSALLEIREAYDSLAEELAERNDILRYEYKREAKHRKIEEQNRLYDLLQSATQTQIDRIAVLTKQYQQNSNSNPDKADILLAEIAVLCSYIKRRKHLTLLTDREYKVAVSELERAFTESLQTLNLLHVRSTLYVDHACAMLTGKIAAALFDFYEEVVETDLEHLTGIQVSLTNISGVRLSLHICCTADLSGFADRMGVCYEADEDDSYQHLIFLPEGGVIK